MGSPSPTDKGYDYDKIWLPHDSKAKSLQTGRSTVEQFVSYFRDEMEVQVLVVPKLSVQHGIDAARKILPTCYFDSETCYDGIEALRAYRRSFNEVSKQFSKAPLHDWASNGADSFRSLALVTQEHLQLEKKAAIVHEPLLVAPKYTLEELFKENEHESSWRGSILRI